MQPLPHLTQDTTEKYFELGVGASIIETNLGCLDFKPISRKTDDRYITVKKDCVVTGCNMWFDQADNKEWTLKFSDGTEMKIRQDFLANFEVGDSIKAGTIIGNYERHLKDSFPHSCISIFLDGQQKKNPREYGVNL